MTSFMEFSSAFCLPLPFWSVSAFWSVSVLDFLLFILYFYCYNKQICATDMYLGLIFSDQWGTGTGPDFQYRQTRHVPRAAALQGRHFHQKRKKQKECGKQTLLICSIPILPCNNIGLFGIKILVI